MNGPVSVTFRDQITGRINDLLIDEYKACAPSQNLLAYLAGAILNYKDEGVEFSPNIVFCESIERFTRSFPGAIAYTIGEASLDPLSGARILKDCGPLSGLNWVIFIERRDDTLIRFGVFAYHRLPTAIPLHEGIAIDPTQMCILLRKVSPNTIELRGAKGSILTLVFSTVRDSQISVGDIDNFARACCHDLNDQPNTDVFRLYLGRLIDSTLSMSHGTMLLCGRNLDLGSVKELKDAVQLSPSLDFFSIFTDFHRSSTAESILTLQRGEELLSGFVRCDGMIVFNTFGQVVAYRVFYRSTEGGSAMTGVVGGARRRAFEGLRGLLSEQLTSILFRSQDGMTLHSGFSS